MPPVSRNALLVAVALLVATRVYAADTECVARSGNSWSRPGSFIAKAQRPFFAIGVALKSFTRSKLHTAPPPAPESTDFALQSNDTVDEKLPAPIVPSFDSDRDQSSLPPFLGWIRGFRMDKDRGLYRAMGGSRVAVAYSDVFDTRGNPEKGGHGLSFVFRHDMGPASGENGMN